MAKKITVIPSVSESLHTQMKPRIRVCGYARVSTASMAQADSYAAQVGYYTEKIQSNPLWEFAGVYADEGITGTKAKGRYDFNEMIASFQKEFRVLSEENEVSFTFQLPDESIMVWADKEKLSIVIRNIISNAFKFTHSGGSIYVTTGLTDDGKRCFVRVEDNERAFHKVS